MSEQTGTRGTEGKISAPLMIGDIKRGQRPMVSVVPVLPPTEPMRFRVDCAACGRAVQFTGEGGYTDMEDAKQAALLHRIAHVNVLVEEMMAGLDDGQ